MIGVYGGSFDPVHLGHIRIAREVCVSLDLEQVLFIPNCNPPHRASAAVSTEDRVAMLRLAVDHETQFKIDLREIKRVGVSYMIDTLKSIREDYPSTSLILLVGEDAFNNFDQWRCWRDIFSLCHIAIINRPKIKLTCQGLLAKEYADRFRQDKASLMQEKSGYIIRCTVVEQEIASSQIRELLIKKKGISSLVTTSVKNYIAEHELYTC